MIRTLTRRTALLTTALVGIATGAQAQGVDVSVEASNEADILVTGSRLQNERAIDVRARNVQVVDSTTSDEVGRLPDFNVGEALQRLPGVAVQNDQAEARFVTVRAMNANYNYTTVDGVSIAVPDRNGRRVFMDVMPASLADRVDVYKTFTPNLEGGAIGGIIDIRTASAFDRGRASLEASADIGIYENDEGFNGSGPSGSLDLTYSTTFGAADQFGLVVFGNYYKRDSYIPQTEAGSTHYFYDASGRSAGQPGVNDGVYPGTGYAVPGERRWYWYHNDRERYGGGAKLEARTANDDYLFIRGFWNQATDNEVRQTDLLTHSGGGTLTNQTPTSGELRGATGISIQENLGQFQFERSVWAVTGGGDHSLGNGDLQWRLNYSGSRFRNPENWVEWRQNGAAGNFAYERDGDVYHFTPLDEAAFYNLGAYAPYRRQFDDRQLDEDLYEAKLDYDHDLGGGLSLAAGAGIRRIERAFNEDRDRYLPTGANGYTLLASGALRDDKCLEAPGALPGQCMLVIDPARATSSFDAHFAANPTLWRFDDMVTNDNNLDYAINETVLSGYGLARYSDDRWDLILGARYEDTSTEGTGRRSIAGVWSDVSSEGGYGHFLPSANARYSLSDAVKLRAAYSRTIGRPAFSDIAPVGEALTEDGSRITLSRPNPELKPRRSDNFDLAGDWYFDNGQGLVSISLFYKRVKDEFFTATDTQLIDFDGRQVEAEVTQPRNVGEPVNIKGVELNLVKNLDFLPYPLDGLTVSGNATFLDTDFRQRMNDGSFVELKTMIGQPNESYNLALSYDKGPLAARLAYNYIGLKLSERINTGTAYRNRYDGAEETLDFRLRYRLSQGLFATFTAQNITGEGRSEYMGWNQELPMVKADIGAAYFLGFSFAM